MIIAVADLHLGSQMANKTGFSRFINEYLEPNQDDISQIVLLGDILDLWRSSNTQVLLQNFDFLIELGRLEMEKNYLAGNHDYAIFSLLSQSAIPIPDSTGVLDQVSEILNLTFDGLKLRFIHGHQVDYWPALDFYEVFSQAMCFVDEELPDVWNIVHRFAESLPDMTRNLVRNLSNDVQENIENKLAGPLDGNMEGEKTGLLYEWELLRKVSIFNDFAERFSTSVEHIELFAKEWEEMLRSLDNHDDRRIPQHLQDTVHQKRREAASLTVGLDDDEFLIRGHGHEPYCNLEYKVADAGCWIDSKGSFLEISEGKVTVHQWK
jgi:UDP-2,3-diacylglucosamine pyrophosphatase LpxH